MERADLLDAWVRAIRKAVAEAPAPTPLPPEPGLPVLRRLNGHRFIGNGCTRCGAGMATWRGRGKCDGGSFTETDRTRRPGQPDRSHYDLTASEAHHAAK
jgi:hypothetical protein